MASTKRVLQKLYLTAMAVLVLAGAIFLPLSYFDYRKDLARYERFVCFEDHLNRLPMCEINPIGKVRTWVIGTKGWREDVIAKGGTPGRCDIPERDLFDSEQAAFDSLRINCGITVPPDVWFPGQPIDGFSVKHGQDRKYYEVWAPSGDTFSFAAIPWMIAVFLFVLRRWLIWLSRD